MRQGYAGLPKKRNMNNIDIAEQSYSGLVTVLRRQLALSQEDLARQLGVSFATVNRWEKGHSKPSRLARAQLNAFCEQMIARGKLVLQNGQRP
jgi:putative transcriptional regulator